MVEINTILRGIVGSSAYLGMDIASGSDRDEMGIFFEAPEHVVGLSQRDTVTYRDKPDGVRSGPGDLDLVSYGLSRFCRLAAKGNPSILALMYLPDSHYVSTEEAGRALLAIRGAFHSKESGFRHLGYLRSQKAKLNGERSPCVQRPELVERFGYDTKFAMHAVRLGLQGVEYVETGKITLPSPDAQLLRAIRSGEFGVDEVLHMIDGAEAQLEAAANRSTARADLERIDAFLVQAYREAWR